MDICIARVQGIVTGKKIQKPKEGQKGDTKLIVEVSQFTSKGTVIAKISEKNNLNLPFEVGQSFDELVAISFWNYNNHAGTTIRLSDDEIQEVKLSFEPEKKMPK